MAPAAAFRLFVCLGPLPAVLTALVPSHPYSRSHRPRAATDVRWPVVALAGSDGDPQQGTSVATSKRADELLQALSKADGGGPEPKPEEEEPSGLSMASVKKEWALLQQGEGVRAVISNPRGAASPPSIPVPGMCRRPTSSSPSSCRPLLSSLRFVF